MGLHFQRYLYIVRKKSKYWKSDFSIDTFWSIVEFQQLYVYEHWLNIT